MASPLTAEALRWLAGPDGRRCLERAGALDASDSLTAQTALRRDFPADRCRAALALAEARRAAAAKFGEAAGRLFADRDGVEMASRPDVAALRARRFEGMGPIWDLGCGVGSDLVALARRGPVWGLDLDVSRLAAARLNVEVAGVGDRVALVRADAARPPVAADLPFYADPARRRAGRRVRAGAAYSPPLDVLLERGRRAPAAGIKVAPGIRDSDLPGDAEVEFVSAAGQCREGIIWLGAAAGPRRRATVLPGPHTLTDEVEAAAPVPVAPPGDLLYDPDPAVVRAHLIQPLARRLEAWRLDAEIAYLSADGDPRDTPLARAHRILDCLPFQPKRLRAYLRDAGWVAGIIKKRRFPVNVDEVRRLLGPQGKGPGAAVTLILTRLADRPTVFVCQGPT